MTFGNPWALTGLAAIAAPIAIHFLGRNKARLLRFPSLRFIDASRLMPTRRTRLTDLPLLFVRVLIAAAAAFALARPIFSRATAEAGSKGAMARAIVVDTSSSVGRAGIDHSVRRARSFADSSAVSTIITTTSPTAGILGAGQWLGQQRGQRELVIISDFAVGVIDSIDFARLPSDVGVKLEQVGRTPPATHGEFGSGVAAPLLLGGADQQPAIAAARSAAVAISGEAIGDTSHRVAIIYGQYAPRASLVGGAKPIDTPWMGEAIVRLARDSTLIDAAHDVVALAGVAVPDVATPIIRGAGNTPLILAARGEIDGHEVLELWMRGAPASVASAALISAANHLTSASVPAAEAETATLPSATLRRWERAPGAATGQIETNGQSDGRWPWLVALLLLILESFMRLAPATISPTREEEIRRAA